MDNGDHGQTDELTCEDPFELTLNGDPAEGERFRAEVGTGNLKVDLREESGSGTIVLDWGSREAGGRQRTGTHDPQEAINRAVKALRMDLSKEKAREDVRRAVRGEEDQLYLGQVARLIRAECLAQREESHRTDRLRLVLDLAEAIWGEDCPYRQIGQAEVEEFLETRIQETVHFPPSSDRQPLGPVKPSTALAYLQDISAAFNEARKLKDERGNRRVPPNPLGDVDWPDGPRYEKSRTETAPPKLYRKLVNSTTNPETEGQLPAPIDRADPKGRARAIVSLAFFHGRRSGADRGVRVGDLLFREDRIRQALAEAGGNHQLGWAPVFAEHGAICWRTETDKEGYFRVVPMHPTLRREMKLYLERRGIAIEEIPERADEPLFPADQDPSSPMPESSLIRSRERRDGIVKKGGYLTEAFYILREELRRQGQNPDRIVPATPHPDPDRVSFAFKMHGFRSRWATLLQRLGWKAQDQGGEDLDKYASFVGGWTIEGQDVKKNRYVELDPRGLVAVACFEPASEFLKKRGEERKERLTKELGELEENPVMPTQAAEIEQAA